MHYVLHSNCTAQFCGRLCETMLCCGEGHDVLVTTLFCARNAPQFFIASSTGAYVREWLAMTQGSGALSVACVFLTVDEQGRRAGFGKHIEAGNDWIGRGCKCRELYDGVDPGFPDKGWGWTAETGSPSHGQCAWGCCWYEKWVECVERCHARGQTAVVLHKTRSDKGDKFDWIDVRHTPARDESKPGPAEQLNSVSLNVSSVSSSRDRLQKRWDWEGVGNSQRGEISYLRRRNIPFVVYDIADWQRFVVLSKKCAAVGTPLQRLSAWLHASDDDPAVGEDGGEEFCGRFSGREELTLFEQFGSHFLSIFGDIFVQELASQTSRQAMLAAIDACVAPPPDCITSVGRGCYTHYNATLDGKRRLLQRLHNELHFDCGDMTTCNWATAEAAARLDVGQRLDI